MQTAQMTKLFFANISTQAKFLLHSLEQASGSMGLHVNADICFNQKGDIYTLNGGSLKLVNKFTNLRSNVSSTKNDINTWLAKAWTAINRLSVTWKSDQSDKIKSSSHVHTTIWMHHMDTD